jgi:hypothetical protein
MMPDSALRDFVAFTAAGVALVVSGGAALGGGRRARLVIWVLAVAAAAALALFISGPSAFGLALVVAGVPLCLAALLRTDRWHLPLHRLGSPKLQMVGLVTVGAGLLVVSAARFDAADAEAADADMAFMARVTWKPTVRQVTALTTDAGRPVYPWEALDPRPRAAVAAAEREVLATSGFPLSAIRRGPASDACNCHGWVFTGGRFWLTAEDVDVILADNGYRAVSDARPGDLVVYRSGGVIGHTAVVRSTGDGLGILVEGKWGWMSVFVHPVGESGYGQKYTFHRSSRVGHLLNGLSRP